MSNMVDALNKVFSSFKIKAKCIDANSHRHFAYFDVKLMPGCRINKIMSFSQEMAIEMRTSTAFSVKPIPEKGIVRLQTTIGKPETINLSDLYRQNPKPEGLIPFLIGETDEGKPLWVEMSKNPHLLIAGSTGSGKSVLLHNIIANASFVNDVDLFLVDTKKVEFNIYRSSSFSRFVKCVAQDFSSAIQVLKYLNRKMDDRYDAMCNYGISSIEQRPNLFKKIVLIVDEVSDLILYDKKNKEFENLVIRLAQKARAAGIYIVLATQRPSVDVITGLIKANFPARLSCKVSSKRDSMVILDTPGAESLAGRGDAILNNDIFDMVRLRVGYITPQEILNIERIRYS